MKFILSSLTITLNTRGYYKGITKEFYPGKWVLEKCFNFDIPVTISSDAHHPKDIDNNFEEAASLLLKIGFEKINIFEEGKLCEIGPEKRG